MFTKNHEFEDYNWCSNLCGLVKQTEENQPVYLCFT